MQISFGFDTAFARQKHILVDENDAIAKAVPGAVGFQPPEKGLAPATKRYLHQPLQGILEKYHYRIKLNHIVS